MNNNKYDVIIIGSGIGGSACAALLSHAGFKTLVLEKNERIGGFTSCYEKQGFMIDISIHVFSFVPKKCCCNCVQSYISTQFSFFVFVLFFILSLLSFVNSYIQKRFFIFKNQKYDVQSTTTSLPSPTTTIHGPWFG